MNELIKTAWDKNEFSLLVLYPQGTRDFLNSVLEALVVKTDAHLLFFSSKISQDYRLDITLHSSTFLTIPFLLIIYLKDVKKLFEGKDKSLLIYGQIDIDCETILGTGRSVILSDGQNSSAFKLTKLIAESKEQLIRHQEQACTL